MLNKLPEFIRRYGLLDKGDSVICAVSGGADSMALLWAMYLLREKLGIHLSAAHFNHQLRGGESDRDEAFVRQFCQDYKIPFYLGSARVEPGKKGLEAAARDARYAFLRQLPGKIATAHTANDNAETVLMHLVRGTGLKGLGGISPGRENLIRPMLLVTRQEVLAFLEEYSIPYVEDSSNSGDTFLRNRVRHSVMPLLEQENPRLAENLSATALRLRQDERALDQVAVVTAEVAQLRAMPPAVRSRVLGKLLVGWGVKEPEAEHIALLEQLVFSKRPSAKAEFPAGVCVSRNYGHLEKIEQTVTFAPVALNCPGVTRIPELGIEITCAPVGRTLPGSYLVNSTGQLVARPRAAGDTMRLGGGTKSLKKLFIDRKVPAHLRERIVVVCDGDGILAVQGVGANGDRQGNPNIQICFETV